MRSGLVINLVGRTYGRLKVVSLHGKVSAAYYWVCECECGNTSLVQGGHLKSGGIVSCGCYRIERKPARIHGETNPMTKEYRAWTGMIFRCYGKGGKRYVDYGGRGIRICKRWLNSYENFLTDMGRAPSRIHSLDRIDNNKNYSPANCKWSTPKEQANNRRKPKKQNYAKRPHE